MLDSVTKRRIDSCRDILVGKVPDPKSQVEQITIALIYKFMDDMDMEAEELGGKRSFFTGGFARYSWSNLMASDRGGFEVLALYSEAIQKMSQNIALPALFRDIFKNAYLPYRDPETLRSFLKEIQAFSYDHSEKLGDAFEYLLSVLGSQGDAGQFRTPRHIIDFMVAVIDPQKTESILDMACGTAGFLISSYKHILQHNTVQRVGDKLTPDERKRLVQNIKGYDISPDMVRLSLVNLYLHGFSEPHIIEYDTLTSEERWNELADVILANPPFMSPKGGIKPHKRFSVQSKRSEVLFVDYIAEHLTPQGRAAIVVPEGIIFQSGTAYKQLREMLLKTSLVAVISLPAGVFNPYSGVKTSILILDKPLAKKTQQIAFVKIDNDGFGLGAQRRAIDKNDLPEAHRQLSAWLAALRGGQPVDATALPLLSLIDKTRIAENGEKSLNADRYQQETDKVNKYPFISLEEIAENLDSKRKPVTKSDRVAGIYPYYGASGIVDYVAEYIFDEELLLISEDGANLTARVTPIAFSISGKTWVNNHAHVLRFKDHITQKYIEYCINSMNIAGFVTGSAQPKLNQQSLNSIKIPFPPLDVRKAIVTEIESYQKIIDGARQVVENYQPRISVDAEWKVVKLEDITEVITDGDHQPPPKSSEGVPFVTISNIKQGQGIDFSKTFFVSEEYYNNLKEYRRPRQGDILYTVTGSYGISVLVDFDEPFCFQRHIGLIRPASTIDTKYLYFYLQSSNAMEQAHKAATGVAQKTVSLSSLRNYLIPLPDIETQRAIVAEIEQEQRLVDANKELVRVFEGKVKRVVERVWGK